jgi:hypothetical protein
VNLRPVVRIRPGLLTDALRRDLSRPSFVGSSPGGGQPRLGRDTERDPVEPARHRALPTDRAGPLGEDQEDDLERILSVVRVAQHLLADAQDHWSVSLDQEKNWCQFYFPGEELVSVLFPREELVSVLFPRRKQN